MKKTNQQILIGKKFHYADLLWVEKKDRADIKQLYSHWVELKNGLKNFESRSPNLPEGISESAFSLEFGCPRVLGVQGTSSSFDCYNPKTHERLQIKATTIEFDLTSFGPASVWDTLYFLDFYRTGKFDGKYDVYKIPNNLIYNHQVNKKQTFKQIQAQGKRPRFSIKKSIIALNKIKPVKTCTV